MDASRDRALWIIIRASLFNSQHILLSLSTPYVALVMSFLLHNKSCNSTRHCSRLVTKLYSLFNALQFVRIKEWGAISFSLFLPSCIPFFLSCTLSFLHSEINHLAAYVTPVSYVVTLMEDGCKVSHPAITLPGAILSPMLPGPESSAVSLSRSLLPTCASILCLLIFSLATDLLALICNLGAGQ